jgi:hypothetical protein
MMNKRRKFIVAALALSSVLGGCSAEEIGRAFYNTGKQMCEQAGNCDMRNEDRRIPQK